MHNRYLHFNLYQEIKPSNAYIFLIEKKVRDRNIRAHKN